MFLTFVFDIRSVYRLGDSTLYTGDFVILFLERAGRHKPHLQSKRLSFPNSRAKELSKLLLSLSY